MSFPEGDEDAYRALVVDSGPIIRQTGLANLRGKAAHYYTVPAVLQEIRDAKARQHLDQLPFDLVPREPSSRAVQAVIGFARQTGDYHSLSSVDVQVLALQYDLECEGCAGDTSHIRTTPKRTLGVGKIQSLAPKKADDDAESAADTESLSVQPTGEAFFAGADAESFDDDDDSDSEEDEYEEEERAALEAHAPNDEDNQEISAEAPKSAAPVAKSWAMLVNPKIASETAPTDDMNVAPATTKMMAVKISSSSPQDDSGGQFSDAEDDDSVDLRVHEPSKPDDEAPNKELSFDFPSLQASLAVPYNEEEDIAFIKANASPSPIVATPLTEEEHERRKQESLRPVSKSGKLYNSFRKYKKVLNAKKPAQSESQDDDIQEEEEEKKMQAVVESDPEETKVQSRILGGGAGVDEGDDFEDDGEGWVTCARDLRNMKAHGGLDPGKNPNDLNSAAPALTGPPKSQRTACTTTDFAMQNVILQMNLELLSVDGIRIRRLKSWVTRCGACFKIYSSSSMSEGPSGMKRLFCSHCGSDMMQRIAASVDSKTGRLRLHMSKRYKNNLRGTKFSLPKPGTANKYQGDLLLREDQLLTGAWNQKAKMSQGGKSRAAAQSIFGKDLASNVGCTPTALNADDIRVGFGRRNPNSAKGRERRGKKKKSSDRACGLRRY